MSQRKNEIEKRFREINKLKKPFQKIIERNNSIARNWQNELKDIVKENARYKSLKKYLDEQHKKAKPSKKNVAKLLKNRETKSLGLKRRK